jgi:hypothetical protein
VVWPIGDDDYICERWTKVHDCYQDSGYAPMLNMEIQPFSFYIPSNLNYCIYPKYQKCAVHYLLEYHHQVSEIQTQKYNQLHVMRVRCEHISDDSHLESL